MYVFKENNHALVLFLFGSRHWFLALFSLANQSSTEDSDFIWGKEKDFKKKNQTTGVLCSTLSLGQKQGGHQGQRCVDRHPRSEDRCSQSRVCRKLSRPSRWSCQLLTHEKEPVRGLLTLTNTVFVVETKLVRINWYSMNQEEIFFHFQIKFLLDWSVWISVSSFFPDPDSSLSPNHLASLPPLPFI